MLTRRDGLPERLGPAERHGIDHGQPPGRGHLDQAQGFPLHNHSLVFLVNAYTRTSIAHFILESEVHRHDDLHSRTLQSAGQKPEFAAEPLRP